MDSLEAEELHDFLTNFQFPWEHKLDESRAAQTLPCGRVLSDTTPARKGKRLSGKVLLEEFSGRCTPGNAIDGAIDSNLPDQPSFGGILQAPEDTVLKDAKHALLVDESDCPSRGKRKDRRRQSSRLKRRESVALLEIIGEIATPSENGPIVQRSPPDDYNRAPDRLVEKAKAKSSRRRSTRLSGIDRPLLELGENGIPKLVRSRDVGKCPNVPAEFGDAPKCDRRNEEEHLGSGQLSYRHDSQTTGQNHVACGVESSMPFGSSESNVGYGVMLESPLTPLQTVSHGSHDVGEGVDLHHSPCTPDGKMLVSFDSLVRYPEALEPHHHNVDENISCKRGVYGTEVPREDVHLDVKVEVSLRPDSSAVNVAFGSQWTNDVVLEVSGETCLTAAMETDKENVSFYSEPCEDMEVDQKVKDLYLKKGRQVPRNKQNTNLETIFEELRPDDVSVGRRKYRRFLAFPEKPWQTRKGTKGKKRAIMRRKSRKKHRE